MPAPKRPKTVLRKPLTPLQRAIAKALSGKRDYDFVFAVKFTCSCKKTLMLSMGWNVCPNCWEQIKVSAGSLYTSTKGKAKAPKGQTVLGPFAALL